MTQRGNHGEDIFFSDDDRQRYLMILTEQCETYGVSLLGYCLMSNHIHLILMPTTEDGLSHAVGRANFNYTGYLNRKLGRRGHLWQDRFYSCPMDRIHFFRAMAYVERNPVRAGLVSQAWHWPWSSATAHVEGKCTSGLLDLASWDEWQYQGTVWREQLELLPDEKFVASHRKSLNSGRPLGENEFVCSIEKRLGRSLRAGPMGRPRKKTD
ncbi:MAG: transposase [Phycisphaerales bacterium]|nr:transposase [Phycisphaerales bacterium]